MKIRLATMEDLQKIASYDSHISQDKLEDCIRGGQVYGLWELDEPVGVLRWSLFWQSVPFVDLLYLDGRCRGKGYGSCMMAHWEREMERRGYRYGMLSTQADETAKFFYEKLGYRPIGAFRPPEQEADEIMYAKEWSR